MTTEEKAILSKILNYILEGTENKEKKKRTEDDNTFHDDTKTQIASRDAEYTTLLKHFVTLTKTRNILKEFFKWAFFLSIIVAMIVLGDIVVRIFDKYLSYATIVQLTEAIPLLITTIVSFVSAIIAIPVVITKYLFSTKEDENITNIILHTQDHDVNGRQWMMEFKKIFKTIGVNSSGAQNTPPDSTASNNNNETPPAA